MSSIIFNPQVKLILADVDETIADVYLPADDQLIQKLNKLLAKGIRLFLVSGGGLNSICDRVVLRINKNLRKNILISHCSGSEVWGFDDDGELSLSPFYSVYEDALDEESRKTWRIAVNKIIKEFNLKILPTMPVAEFKLKTLDDPLSIMYDDRGPQITFEVVNGYNLTESASRKIKFDIPLTNGIYDIRVSIVKRANELFKEANLPIDSRIEGVFALNFAIEGASKETSIRKILEVPEHLKYFDLTAKDISNPDNIEIWGDKFSELGGKRDSLMSRSVDPSVRSIDFRLEDPKELPSGYNINIWDGRKHLHEGLLEYLQQI